MIENEFFHSSELYRGVVLTSNYESGQITVNIPALLGRDGSITINTLDRRAYDGYFAVPDPGTQVIVGTEDKDFMNAYLVRVDPVTVQKSPTWDGSMVNGVIDSPGTTGWAIDGLGNAEFNNGRFRGSVIIGGTIDDVPTGDVIAGASDGGTALQPGEAATDINTNTTTISGNKVRTGSIIANTSIGGVFSTINLDTGAITFPKFTIDSSGNATFSGALSAATGSFQGDITIGSGNNVFKADASGIYLGNSNFGSAPFRVNMVGDVTASSVNITGGTIDIGSGFFVDSSGTATIGNAIFEGFIADNAVDTDAIVNDSIIDSKINNLSANKITAGTLDAARIAANSITTSKLIVGSFDNLISDPNFEIGDSSFVGSVHTVNNNGGVWTLDPTYFRAGTRSARYDATLQTSTASLNFNGLQADTSSHVRCAEGDKFAFNIYVYPVADPGISNVDLRVQWFTSTGASASVAATIAATFTDAVLVPNQWNLLSGNVTAPADAAYLRVQARVVYNDSKRGQFWFDTPYLRRQVGTAFIETAAINNALIADLSADKITTGFLSADRIAANSLSVNSLTSSTLSASQSILLGSGSTIGSSNFVTGSTGWQITGAGNAEFQDVTVRGTINNSTFTGDQTNSGTITGGAIHIGSGNNIFKADSNGIYLGNATFASAPFSVSMAGAVTASNIAISGTSTFAGTITTASISTGHSITIANTGHISSSNFVAGSGGVGFKIDGSGNAEFNTVTIRGVIAQGTLGNGDNINVSGTGYIRSSNYNPGSTGWQIQGDGTAEFGSVTVRGNVTATSGAIGGFTINSNSLTAGSSGTAVGIAPGTFPFYAGSATASSAPFRVSSAGALTATSATITGDITASTGSIGGFTIGSGVLSAGSAGTAVGLAPGTFPFYAGSTTASSAPFRVSSAGAVTATNLTITGGSINLNSGVFQVSTAGALTATSATITGAIQSGSTITGSTITGGSISIGSSNSIFKADSNGIYLGNATFGSAPFRVSMAGALTATSATITGSITASSGSIGGFTIGSGVLSSGSGSTAVGLAPATFPFYAGSTTASSAPFRVSTAGVVTITGSAGTPFGTSTHTFSGPWYTLSSSSLGGATTLASAGNGVLAVLNDTRSTRTDIGHASGYAYLKDNGSTVNGIAQSNSFTIVNNQSTVQIYAGGNLMLQATGTALSVTIPNTADVGTVVHRYNFGVLQASTSTRRVKRDIQTLTPSVAAERIRAIRPVAFKSIIPDDIKRNGDRYYIGFIAEELADVASGLAVWGHPTKKVPGDGPDEGVKYISDVDAPQAPVAVNQTALMSELIAFVQDIDARLQALEN